MGIYGDAGEDAAIRVVLRAVQRGVNFIDTSPLYQESERRLGKALRRLRESGFEDGKDAVPMGKEMFENLIICSKVGDECEPYSNNGGHSPFSFEGVRCSVVNSLANLGIEKLDVVLLHDPTLEEVDEFLAPKTGGLDGLRALRDEGKVQFFGIGCVEHAQQTRFLEGAGEDCSVILTVNDYNLVRRYAECGDRGEEGSPFGRAMSPSFAPSGSQQKIGIMNAGALHMGLLTEPKKMWREGFRKDLRDQYPKLISLCEDIEEWCDCHEPKIEMRALALRFALQHEAVSCVPVGCRTEQEVNEVIDCVTEGEWEDQVLSDAIIAFEEKFGERVRAMDWEKDHWRYDKAANKL